MAIRNDAEKIESGIDLHIIPGQALWNGDVPDWYQTIWREFSAKLTSPKMQAAGWDIWALWYASIPQGNPLFGITHPKLRDELERNIALGSTDGKFNKEFWNREPALINADVKRWVRDAQLVDTTREGQGSGLKFEISNGIVKLFSGLGLASPDSDHARINAQLPILREAIAFLEEKVRAITIEDDVLAAALKAMLTLVACEPKDIDANALFARNIILRSQIEEAQKNPATMANYYQMKGGELATARSIASIADMIVLATKEGEKLFEDADKQAVDAGKSQLLRKAEKELLDILTADGSLIDPEIVELLKLIFLIPITTDHPNRAFYFASGSLRNLTLATIGLVIGGTGLITLGSYLLIFGGVALATFVAVDRVAKGSELGNTLDEVRVKAINNFLKKILLPNEDKIRAAAANRPSWQPIIDLLDRVKEGHEE